MSQPLYQVLSNLIQARLNCEKANNPEWHTRHEVRICELVLEHMPYGSGFDNGTKIDLSKSHEDRIVFTTAFHHMNQYGYYDGWTKHTVTVTPGLLSGFHLRISGSNRDSIKDMMHDYFDLALRDPIAQPA